tara:strand:- start:434 stop:607 length:174 start_codon:yes stop_codon:yes gene_type:complete
MIPKKVPKPELMSFRVDADMKKNIEQIATNNEAIVSDVIRFAISNLIKFNNEQNNNH